MTPHATPMERFLAVHALPPDASEASLRDALERLAVACHDAGVRPIETLFSLERGRAYGLFDAGSAAAVRNAFTRAGLPEPEIAHGQRVFTELLDEPRRQR